MGIRFFCPNGHKLHVKSFLAGKRGICPHCGVKLEIPVESDPALERDKKSAHRQTVSENLNTERAAGIPTSNRSAATGAAAPTPTGQAVASGVPRPTSSTLADAATADSQEATVQAPMPSAPDKTDDSAAAKTADPIEEAPHALWYVRPPSGGQYGPAAGDVLLTWMAEGRVTADSYVWREGWSDWRRASELFPSAFRLGPSAPAPGERPMIVTEPRSSSATVQQQRRKSTRTTAAVVAMLSLACLILFIAFLYVLSL